MLLSPLLSKAFWLPSKAFYRNGFGRKMLDAVGVFGRIRVAA
jgi:hypothetical protein